MLSLIVFIIVVLLIVLWVFCWAAGLILGYFNLLPLILVAVVLYWLYKRATKDVDQGDSELD